MFWVDVGAFAGGPGLSHIHAPRAVIMVFVEKHHSQIPRQVPSGMPMDLIRDSILDRSGIQY